MPVVFDRADAAVTDSIIYDWNIDFTSAVVSWRGRKIAVMLCPNFGKAAYVFNESGEFQRFSSEGAARIHIWKCVESAKQSFEDTCRVA